MSEEVPPPTDLLVETTIDQDDDDVYVRDDGKKVRRVKKLSSIVTSESSDSRNSAEGNSVTSDVYVRADGKKVRRVKRGSKKTEDQTQDAVIEPVVEEAIMQPKNAPEPEAAAAAEPMFPGAPPKAMVAEQQADVKETPVIKSTDLDLEPPLASTEAPEPTVVEPKKAPEPMADLEQPPPPPVAFPPTKQDVLEPTVIEPPAAVEPPAVVESQKTADPALIAASLNNIDSLTCKTLTSASSTEERNPWTSAPSIEESVKYPWTSAPSIEESVKSLDQIQQERNVQPMNPFTDIQDDPQAQEPSVFLVPVDSALSYASSADRYIIPVPTSQDSLDPILKIATSASNTLRDAETQQSQQLCDQSTIPSLAESPVRRNSHNNDATFDESEGGPMWLAASYGASGQQSPHSKMRLPESITARTRSRADVGSFDHSTAGSSHGFDRKYTFIIYKVVKLCDAENHIYIYYISHLCL